MTFDRGDLVQILKPRNQDLHMKVAEVVGFEFGYVRVRLIGSNVDATPMNVHPSQLRGASAVDSLAHVLHHNELCPCGSGLKYKQCHWAGA